MNDVDLFVLAADLDMANALEGLLSRPRDLGIRDVTFVVQRHPGRDGGCRTGSVEFLRPYLERHDHAIQRDVLWQAVGNDLPPLIARLEALVPPEPE